MQKTIEQIDTIRAELYVHQIRSEALKLPIKQRVRIKAALRMLTAAARHLRAISVEGKEA